MTTGHSRLAAVQAAIVAVLLVVVFVTLLEPDSQRPIKGVQGPAGQSPGELPGPDVYSANPGGGGDTQPGGGNGGAPGGVPGGVPSGQGGVPGGAAIPGVPAGPSAPTDTGDLGLTGPGPGPGEDGARDGGSPADNQYQSALLRLPGGLE